MEVGSYIVLDGDTNLKRLRSGDGTLSYTLPGQVLLVPGMIVPVIRAGANCIGIAKIEVTTIREENTTVYFRLIDTKGNYDAFYDAWATTADGGSGRGGNFGIPKARPKFRNVNTNRSFDDEEDDGDNHGGGLTQEDIRRLYGK